MDLQAIELFILDLDGTLTLSGKPLPGAQDFLATLVRLGKKFRYLTNNSSQSARQYEEKLRKIGFPVDKGQVMTSGKATVEYLRRRMPGARIFLLGTPALEEEFLEAGFTLLQGEAERPDAVVFGFDKTLTYDKLRIACSFIAEGVYYVATHPDLNCPVEGGKFIIDTGSFLKAVEASTGRLPQVILGKPSREIYTLLAETTGVSGKAAAMVGDRLYTDLQGAVDAGLSSILVLSGETSWESYVESGLQADLVVNGVMDLREALMEGEK